MTTQTNQPLNPTYSLSTDTYDSLLESGLGQSEAGQRAILRSVGPLGVELVKEYDAMRRDRASRDFAFKTVLELYFEFKAEFQAADV